MEDKNAVFQKLKPPCLALTQSALALSGPQGDRDQVTSNLEALRSILSSVTLRPSALDAKLAEYVFFPLSQVLKASHRVPVRALELCLQCLAVLIDQGWRDRIQPQMAAQIVILCTLLAEKQPKGLAFQQSTDDLRSSAFSCLHRLFAVTKIDSDVQQLLTSDANLPQLGQSLSVVLDGISDGSSAEEQMSACQALDSLVLNVLDIEVQASFLPGSVSKLTRILTPQTKIRRNPKVLIMCLDILGVLFRHTLNDIHQGPETQVSTTSNSLNSARKTIDSAWLEQAATRLKPALSNIVRLRTHSRHDVQDALGRLCSDILQYCRKALANCCYMALQTLVIISAARSDQERITDLNMLVVTNNSICDLLHTVLYDWLRSLITTMQGSDEQNKITQLQQISTSYGLLKEAGVNTTTIDHMLADTLRDSVVTVLTVPRSEIINSATAPPIQSLELDLLNLDKGNMRFGSPLVERRGQENTMLAIERFVDIISNSAGALQLPTNLVRSLRQSSGESLVANFWLLLTAVQDIVQPNDGLDDFLNGEGVGRVAAREHLEELYSYSLSLLSDSTDEPIDRRLQALALRCVALRAQVAGEDFRYELVDALYPVVHSLASPDELLQRDSMTTLNILASTCAYASVQDLIVENVDYLTDSVALKLNSFDISPQAPHVLLMMVRLAGPTLLPHLEDTVDSIFAALEIYQGYPLLVELLFKTLAAMAEEGARSPLLAIIRSSQRLDTSLLRENWQPTTVSGLLNLLTIDRSDSIELSLQSIEPSQSHPKRPWKDSKEDEDEDASEDEINGTEDAQLGDSDPLPPAPKTYNLLFKITELTQHFLPSASPSLRTSLLSLIRTAIPAIARHENSFLPLVNTLWPEITSRLDDSEPYVVANALEIVSVLSEYAGDFMRTRITQLWPRIIEIYRTLVDNMVQANLHLPSSTRTEPREKSSALSKAQVREAVSRMQNAPANYGDTSSRLVWEALVSCITRVVHSVRISPELFDEALEVIAPLLQRHDVVEAFVEENSDAVWLARLRNGLLSAPVLHEAALESRWHFAEALA